MPGTQGQSLTVHDMARHRILTHARRTVPHAQLQDHFLGLAVTPRLVPASNIGACLQMTLDGLGIACLPQEMIGKLLETGQLSELDYAWRPDPLSFAARHDMDPVPTYLREAIAIARQLSPPG
jgi:DNA-binding transcriptional LysR family regulator